MIKAIIFDFDGVIHNTLELGFSTQREIFPELSLEEYKDLFDGNIYQHNKISSSTTSFFELSKPKYAQLIIKESTREELLKLKEKEYSLFIISSGSEEIIKEYVNRNTPAQIFKEILGMETHKSKIEKFKIILEKNNLIKEEVIFVTDTLGDLLEANKLGIKSLAVDFGFHERERLEKGNPIKIISSFDEIAKYLEEQK